MKLEDVFQIKLRARYVVTVHFCNRVDEYNSLGTFHPMTREIKILNSLSIEEKAATLAHELLHAISDAYDVELSERQTERLERGLVKLYQLNPDLKNLLIPL